MKTKEVIARVAERTGLPKSRVRAVLDGLGEVGLEALAAGREVQLKHLGTLGTRQAKARTIRSIDSARKYHVGERTLPRFKPSAGVRRAAAANTPQHWREPAHQAAWRLCDVLTGDLDLYHNDQAPQLSRHDADRDVHGACKEAFGVLWSQVVTSYEQGVALEVRQTEDHLAAAARRLWSNNTTE